METLKLTDMSFEDAMKRLDAINAELSAEGVSLERSLELYEEGVRLCNLCNEKLEATQRKIKMLKMGEGGEVIEEDFDAYENA